MRRATAPIFRGQGNALFKTDRQNSTYRRGQEVPYNVNGAPTPPPAEPGAISIDINGLPTATPSEPLLEFIVPAGGLVFTGAADHISAGIASAAGSDLRYFKNGAANGTIHFAASGTTGSSSFSDSTYAEGDLFGLYPPASVDATLDRVRITLGTD